MVKNLEDLQYHVTAHKLRANEFGLPQRRTRYYIIALKDIFAESPTNILQRISRSLACLRSADPLPVVTFQVGVVNLNVFGRFE